MNTITTSMSNPCGNYRKNPTRNTDIISLTRISPSIDLWMATVIFGQIGGKDTPRINRTRKEGEEGTSKAKYGVVALIGAVVGALFTKAS